jgi:uncharacterized protein (TIGR02145 family)
MTENLREVPAGGVQDKGDNNTTKYYNLPGGEQSNVATYGYLYSWAAATNGENASTSNDGAGKNSQPFIRGICPLGWHLPSDIEWTQLERVLCLDESTTYTTAYGTTDNTWTDDATGYRGRGGTTSLPLDKKMKATNFDSGKSKTATAGGFAALPAGFWGSSSSSGGFDSTANFWCSSSGGDGGAWYRYLYSDTAGSGHSYTNSYYQFSVRCKKN